MTDIWHRAGRRAAPSRRTEIAGATAALARDCRGRWGPELATSCAAAARFVKEHPLRILWLLTVCLSFLFMAMPGLDLEVSRWFGGHAGGFPLAKDETLRDLRDLNRVLPTILLSGLGAILLVHVFRPSSSRWDIRRLARPHQAFFVLSVYGLGCGVVVHALKNFVGRARPRQIAEFGGADAFSVAWQISGACARNCSFSSGEAASAMAMLAFATLVPARWRPAAYAFLVPLVVAFSLNRIAFGSHFLSDVVMSWLIVLMLIVWLRRVFAARAEAIDRAVAGCGLPLANALAQRLGTLRRPQPR